MTNTLANQDDKTDFLDRIQQEEEEKMVKAQASAAALAIRCKLRFPSNIIPFSTFTPKYSGGYTKNNYSNTFTNGNTMNDVRNNGSEIFNNNGSVMVSSL